MSGQVNLLRAQGVKDEVVWMSGSQENAGGRAIGLFPKNTHVSNNVLGSFVEGQIADRPLRYNTTHPATDSP